MYPTPNMTKYSVTLIWTAILLIRNAICNLLFYTTSTEPENFYLTSKVGLLVLVIVSLQSDYPINLVFCFHEEWRELRVCPDKQTQGQRGGGDAVAGLG